MERRKFLLATGSAVLSGATLGVTQKPSFALEFELSGIPNRNPSNVNSILVQFSRFKLTPRYVDYKIPNIHIILVGPR